MGAYCLMAAFARVILTHDAAFIIVAMPNILLLPNESKASCGLSKRAGIGREAS